MLMVWVVARHTCTFSPCMSHACRHSMACKHLSTHAYLAVAATHGAPDHGADASCWTPDGLCWFWWCCCCPGRGLQGAVASRLGVCVGGRGATAAAASAVGLLLGPRARLRAPALLVWLLNGSNDAAAACLALIVVQLAIRAAHRREDAGARAGCERGRVRGRRLHRGGACGCRLPVLLHHVAWARAAAAAAAASLHHVAGLFGLVGLHT